MTGKKKPVDGLTQLGALFVNHELTPAPPPQHLEWEHVPDKDLIPIGERRKNVGDREQIDLPRRTP